MHPARLHPLFTAQRVELMFSSRCTLAQAKETVSKLLTVANVLEPLAQSLATP
jgi:hypothetical protein